MLPTQFQSVVKDIEHCLGDGDGYEIQVVLQNDMVFTGSWSWTKGHPNRDMITLHREDKPDIWIPITSMLFVTLPGGLT